MARIFSATYTPYSYEELAAPVREATAAHQQVENDYNDNMLIVDSLRQRAMSEPDSQWAQQILNYADKLEGYALDLAQNGLTRETRNNLLNMKRGFGTTVSPVITAMAREKELQTIMDKADPKARMLYGAKPTIDLLIADPTMGLTSYSGADAYNQAKAQGSAFAARHVIDPRAIDKWMYKTLVGFTLEDISEALSDPLLNETFNQLRESYGYQQDPTLSDYDKNRMNQEIFLGMMEGLVGQVKYNNRPDDPLTMEKLRGLRTENQINRIKLNALLNGTNSGSGMLHNSYINMDDKYQNLLRHEDILNQMYDEKGNLKPEYKNREIVDKNGKLISFKIEDIYRPLDGWVSYYKAMKDPNAINKPTMMPGKPKGFENVEDEKLLDLWNQIQGYQLVSDVLKDFNLEGDLDNPVFQTRDELRYYLNSLVNNKRSTSIIPTKFDDFAQALNYYTAPDRNEGFAKQIYDVDRGMNIGEPYSRDKLLEELRKIEGKDIVGMDYMISDHDHIYLSLANGKTLRIPLSFFNTELSDSVENLYEKGIWSPDGSLDTKSYKMMEALIKNDPIYTNDRESMYKALSEEQLIYQDVIARFIQDFFKEREDPVHGDTETRN